MELDLFFLNPKREAQLKMNEIVSVATLATSKYDNNGIAPNNQS